MCLYDEGLLESLSAAVAHPSLPAVEQDISSLVGDDDTEARQLRAVAVTVLAVLDSLGEVHVISCIINLMRLIGSEMCAYEFNGQQHSTS